LSVTVISRHECEVFNLTCKQGSMESMSAEDQAQKDLAKRSARYSGLHYKLYIYVLEPCQTKPMDSRESFQEAQL